MLCVKYECVMLIDVRELSRAGMQHQRESEREPEPGEARPASGERDAHVSRDSHNTRRVPAWFWLRKRQRIGPWARNKFIMYIQ